MYTPVLLEVMRHQMLGMLIAFLVWPQRNIAVVDLNGNRLHMAYWLPTERCSQDVRHILESKKEEKKQVTRARKAQGKKENNLYSKDRRDRPAALSKDKDEHVCQDCYGHVQDDSHDDRKLCFIVTVQGSISQRRMTLGPK